MKIILPKEQLYKYYIEEKKSSGEIAKIFNLGRSTILRHLKKNHIPVRKFTNYKRKLYKPLDKDQLYQLYVIENLSSIEIAKRLKTTFDTVIRQLKYYGFGNFIRNSGEKRIIIDKEVLYSLYVNQTLSAEEIAVKYRCSNVTILNWLRRYGLEKFIKIGFKKGKKNPKLSGNLSPTKRPEVKLKMSQNHADFSGDKNPNYGATWMIGDGNPNWLGGISDNGYNWEFNVVLKREIHKRDNYTCQNCGMTEEEHLTQYKEKLHVHHIDYDKNNNDKTNLITLCLNCNIKANYNRSYWTGYFIKGAKYGK
jgi:transposase